MADENEPTSTRGGDDPASTADDAADDTASTAPPADAMAKFREALERKQGTAHRNAQTRRNTGAVHGSEVTGPGKRTFRRKSG